MNDQLASLLRALADGKIIEVKHNGKRRPVYTGRALHLLAALLAQCGEAADPSETWRIKPE